jgi:chaperonin GroEL
VNKQLSFGPDGRAKLIEGANKLANAVKCTLGAKGRLVVIQHVGYAPQVTKDGYTVAKNMFLSDNGEDIGAQLLKQAAAKTVQDTGDGTSTSTILAQAIMNAGINAMVTGANPVMLKKGIEAAVKDVTAKIAEMSIPVEGDMVKQIATISANGDELIGGLVAEAIDAAGENGLVQIENVGAAQSSVLIKPGSSYDCGWISPYFITNPAKMTAEYENPVVIIVGRKLKKFKEVMPLLEMAGSSPILLIADDFDAEVSQTCILHRSKHGAAIVLVKAPQYGDKRQVLEDIACQFGANILDEPLGFKFPSAASKGNINSSNFGTSAKIVVSQESLTIIGDGENFADIEERAASLRAQIEENPENAAVLQQRLTKLVGKVAVISIGGSTEAEIAERRDRADDAIGACRAAKAEGVVPGGGVALVNAIQANSLLDGDVSIGYMLTMGALLSPLNTLLTNSGVDAKPIMETIMAKGDDPNYGYDVLTDKFTDMVQAGIIDPAKVVRCALENAASVASLILTTECVMALEVNNNFANRG